MIFDLALFVGLPALLTLGTVAAIVEEAIASGELPWKMVGVFIICAGLLTGGLLLVHG